MNKGYQQALENIAYQKVKYFFEIPEADHYYAFLNDIEVWEMPEHKPLIEELTDISMVVCKTYNVTHEQFTKDIMSEIDNKMDRVMEKILQ